MVNYDHQKLILINWLNNHKNTDFSKLPLNSQSLATDSWLAGFIDADGSFYIRYTEVLSAKTGSRSPHSKVRVRIACRLSIEQRLVDPPKGKRSLYLTPFVHTNCPLLWG